MPPRVVLPSAALPEEVPLPAEAIRRAAPSAAAPPERPSAELPGLAQPDRTQPGPTRPDRAQSDPARPDRAQRARVRPLPVEPDLPQHGRAEPEEQAPAPAPAPSPASASGALPPEVPVPAAEPAPAGRPAAAASVSAAQPAPSASLAPTAAAQGPGPAAAPSASAAPGAELPAAEPSPAAPPAAAEPPAADPPPESPAPVPAPVRAAVTVEDPNASPDAILIRRTLGEIGPVADQVTSYFYALLFVRHPDLRSLFPVAMDAQRDRLLKALLTAAEHMDSPAVLTDYLRQLGRGHRKYGTQATHYPAVGEALIGALTRYATNTWDEETEGAWVRTYTTISQIMIDAAAENERHAPAWWQAEVVSHELRTSDIAVVTVRPDQPYPFLAGQYTSLETPWWPRVWRHYSFASAPRPDGLLAFHVKAVPAGWVSNALVHRAVPGDVLRLGPPAGSMTVDHSTDNGLLCLGGGTGIAPIKALVEDVAERGHRRPVEVFYGARHDQDLYDIDTMLRLQRVHPWLSVRPVISEGPSLGLTGRLPEAVRDSGPWHEYDGYLSGPPGMIRSGVDALRGAGIPFERIRHDSLEELVAAAT
ncbi:globin domain-containing protein [Streptomyces sp. NPDC087420]|uniref:globin domain-containing protein n=1 Tax=Streptomyces sp. NPDC087420 TaxID=3365785 RepID=UPI0038373A86